MGPLRVAHIKLSLAAAIFIQVGPGKTQWEYQPISINFPDYARLRQQQVVLTWRSDGDHLMMPKSAPFALRNHRLREALPGEECHSGKCGLHVQYMSG